MAGLVLACPGHPRLACWSGCKKDVDARDKRGHDGGWAGPLRGPGNLGRGGSRAAAGGRATSAGMTAVGRCPYAAMSTWGGVAREQRRGRCFVRMHVFAIHPLGYEMAVLMPHHHFRAPPGKTVHFRKGDGAANRLGLACIGLGISSSSLDDLPPRLLADDHIS